MVLRRAAHLAFLLGSQCLHLHNGLSSDELARAKLSLYFLRSPRADLAQRLQKDLATKFDAWLDTQRLSAGDIWSSEIEQAIDRADVVLALLSAGSFTSDICRAEQGRALDKGKCVLPLRVQSDCDIPLQLQTPNGQKTGTR